MNILKSLGRSILIAIITAVILFNLFLGLATYGQMMFDEGRKYEINKSERTGGFLPTGVMENRHKDSTRRHRDSSE